MDTRRQFLRMALGFLPSIGFMTGLLFSGVKRAYARAKKTILPKGTKRESLIHRDPRSLDTRNLEITPVNDFGTMGTSDHKVDLDKWRLEIKGSVKRPLKLSYREIVAMSSTEREVLLVCPGVFVNHGRWKGLVMKALLERAVLEPHATHVTFSGPNGSYEKEERFPIGDILSNKVFLAYGVNGKSLPTKHGFPLRVVAEGYFGDEWVKYVHRMTVEKK